MPYIERPLDTSETTTLTIKQGGDRINNNFEEIATGDMTITGKKTFDNIAFNTATTTQATKGQFAWNEDEGTLDLGLNGGNVTLQLGQETVYRVTNNSGATITNGMLVMAVGTVGASGRILVAPYDGTSPSKRIMGLATENIPNGQDGYVTHFGKVRGINTSAYQEGDILWASPSGNGALTKVKPEAPNSKTIVAIVINSHASVGTVLVRVSQGSNLDDDELVELGTLNNGDILLYNTATGRFENKSLTQEVGGYFDISYVPSIQPTVQSNLSRNKHKRYEQYGLEPKTITDIWEVNRNSTATYFDANGILRTAAPHEPRIHFDPSTGENLGLLVEGQSTNLLLWSEDFTQSSWFTQNGGLIEPNAAIAPDDSNTASILKASEGEFSGGPLVRQNIDIGDPRTLSIYAKAGSYNFIKLNPRSFGVISPIIVDLVTGEIIGVSSSVPAITPQVIDVGGGWWRISLHTVSEGTVRTFRVAMPRNLASTSEDGGTYTGDEFIYIWGAQMELGLKPTSYIPTQASTVTRLGELVTLKGAE